MQPFHNVNVLLIRGLLFRQKTNTESKNGRYFVADPETNQIQIMQHLCRMYLNLVSVEDYGMKIYF